MKALRWPLWCLEAVPFFAMMGLFKVLGVDAASWFGGWLARMLAPIAPAHTTARKNLEAAFPEKSPAEIKAILTGMWDNLGRTFAEYAHFRTFTGYPNARIAIRNIEIAQSAVAQGKGVVALSGHSANWELLALAAWQSGLDGVGVYRPVNNPLVDWWIMRQRRAYSYPVQVSKNGDLRPLLRALKDGRTIAMLTDQKHSEGMPIPFFGRDAWTASGPAVLSLRTGAALLPAQMVRTSGARFEMTYRPLLAVSPSGDKEADIRAVLTTISMFMEEIVREHPEQWLWAHNRWRIPEHAQPGMGGAAS